MQITMNDSATVAAVVVGITLIALSGIWAAYDYNVQFVKKGYSQVQLQNSQMTMWVLGTNSPTK